MNGQNLGHLWSALPSPEMSHALAMLLRDLFLRAPAELPARLAGAEGPVGNVYEVRQEHNPLIGICYHPSLTEEALFLAGISPAVFSQKWAEFMDARRREYGENETRRSEESHFRLSRRPFRVRYELYTEPEYAVELVNRLVYPGDRETSVYFRTEKLDGDVGWNWPLRIGFLPDDASARLFEEMETYVRDIKEWIGPLVDLVRLDSETDYCDLLLIPTSIQEACDLVSNLGIRISADSVVAIGPTTDYHWEIPKITEVFTDIVSTAGVGIAPVDTSLCNWFATLIRELSHNEPIDVALFSACFYSGSKPPFLAASRKLIEFSKLTESIKSIGEELLKASPDAQPVTILNGEVFGIEPGDYHPREIGKIFRNNTDKFMFDEERRSGTRSASVTRSAKRSMRRSEKPEKVEPRWIQADVYDLSADAKAPAKLKNALRAGAPHKAVILIGTTGAGSIQNREEFDPKELSDKKTYKLTVIFTELQLFNEPQVSSIKLPPRGNSTKCEFTFQVPEDVEKIEARISIVYKNRVLQTALLKADVVADPADTGGKHSIEIVPEAMVRGDLSGLKHRRNFDGAFILNHDTGNAPGLTAIKDKYVSFSSLGELDSFVKKVDEFMTKVADYPGEYAGKLDIPATVTLMCDLAKHGRSLHRALAEFPRGNMTEIFSALSQTDPKITQRIQIISAKSDTRLPMEFLYDRKAPEKSDGQLCPKAEEALKQDACFPDCSGMLEPEKHVCPMGFWGLSKIIERHTYNTRYTEKEVDGTFRFQSEPVEGRNHLDIFKGVLFGASNKADKIEVRSADGQTVTVEPGGLSKVLSVLDTVTNSKNQKVTSWKEWRDKINSAPSPTALLLLTHTEKSGSVPALEIEEGVLVEMQSIEEDYVYSRKEPSPPVVFLIGCETGAADIEFMNFVAQFRRGGAAIIVSTGAPIRGRHAVPVTLELLNQLKKYSDQPATSFGQVMRIVKQKMVAEGFPMVLTLMTYGDADWQIGTSKP
jgi:hypothetical protein